MQSFKCDLLRRADIILWDEASMIPKGALRVVDKLLRDIMQVDVPFGGKLLILGGDFRQVLPVVPHATPEQIVAETILYHYTWREKMMRKYTLTENMRARQDGGHNDAFREWLLRVGHRLSSSLLCVPEAWRSVVTATAPRHVYVLWQLRRRF